MKRELSVTMNSDVIDEMFTDHAMKVGLVKPEQEVVVKDMTYNPSVTTVDIEIIETKECV